jgi:L-threonylcarbamoyladenylate synthase
VGAGRGSACSGHRSRLKLERLSVDADHPSDAAIARAAAELIASRLVIYPTDTLYALGGRALDPEAVGAIRRAKGRPEKKPLPLVAADVGQARSLCASWPESAMRLAERFWPGPLSLVLPARADVPGEVTSGTGHVALRVPARKLPRRLCARVGPLVSTSANEAGKPAPVDCDQAVAGVGAFAALALDGGPGRPEPSTIVDLTGATPRLLRSGAVPWPEVLALLR